MAGFVGTSNILSGDVAEAVLGRRGTFTVRPGEDPHRPARTPTVAPGFVAVPGHVRDVVYLGSDTRYHVALDGGGELAVLEQNVTTSSMEVLALKDRPVRLTWDQRHTLAVDPGRGGARHRGGERHELESIPAAHVGRAARPC